MGGRLGGGSPLGHAPQQRPSVSLAWPKPSCSVSGWAEGAAGGWVTQNGETKSETRSRASVANSSLNRVHVVFLPPQHIKDHWRARFSEWQTENKKERDVWKGKKMHSETCRLPLLRKIALTICLLTILLYNIRVFPNNNSHHKKASRLKIFCMVFVNNTFQERRTDASEWVTCGDCI